MQDQKKSNAQLIAELQELRSKNADLLNRHLSLEQAYKTNILKKETDGNGFSNNEHDSAYSSVAKIANDDAFRLSTLIEHLPDGIINETPERKVQRVNRKFCEMFGIGVPPEALKGADCREAAQQLKQLFADGDFFVLRIEEILSAGRPVKNEERLCGASLVLPRRDRAQTG